MIDPKEKKILENETEGVVFEWDKFENDSDKNIPSNGSASAFDETEEVREDNFDDLKEK